MRATISRMQQYKNIYFLDWKNHESTARYHALAARYHNVYRINISGSLANTVRICAQLSNLNYFWVVSSLTDYSNFDFAQYSEVGLEPYLQVFGANTWLVSKYHTNLTPAEYLYLDGFPDIHFTKTELESDRKLLDIVYISNGEPEAEKHYQHLLKTVKTGNKIHRIDRIDGRSAAYYAAASVSTTAWFFAVFAKLEVNPEFDWTWYPSATNSPMHYVFNAHNPVNGLEYGHMAMIAYNKLLTLETEYTGLDFVMTKAHDLVPILSGTARYNQNPIVTWRTAFRECIKLRDNGSEESLARLQTWLTMDRGEFGNWSVLGARDAVTYYEAVDGEFDQLLLSYEWSWLNNYFTQRYPGHLTHTRPQFQLHTQLPDQ